MKTLQNNYTTPEQSKRLLELGIPANSADCYYNTDGENIGVLPDNTTFEEFNKSIKRVLCKELSPCWSVGRLIEIIKICSDVPIDWTGGLNEEREILEVVDSTLYALCLGKHMDFSKLEE